MNLRLTFVMAASLLLCAFATANAADKEAAPVKPIRVLFIGNSQIFYNDLPKALEALSKSAPAGVPRIETGRVVFGGAKLQAHWDRGAESPHARFTIANEPWDYVILQDLYSIPEASFAPAARQFHELIKKQGSKTILYATASIDKLYPDAFATIYDMHIALGKELDVPVVAAGKSWLELWGENPTTEERLLLYAKDKAHPGERGSYVNACGLYAAITGQSPVGLTNVIPGWPADVVTPEQAKQYQAAAWKVHQQVNALAERE